MFQDGNLGHKLRIHPVTIQGFTDDQGLEKQYKAHLKVEVKPIPHSD